MPESRPNFQGTTGVLSRLINQTFLLLWKRAMIRTGKVSIQRGAKKELAPWIGSNIGVLCDTKVSSSQS